jgi:hypothetical protein
MEKQWNKAFKRMLNQANQEVAEQEKSWDTTLQRLADEWNEEGRNLCRG